MRFLRIAACLAALFFSLSTLAGGAEVTYSGVPGKWKRGTKSAKAAPSEAEAKPKETRTKKIIDNGKLRVTVAPKSG